MREEVANPFLVEEDRKVVLQLNWLERPHNLRVVAFRSYENWVVPVVVGLRS